MANELSIPEHQFSVSVVDMMSALVAEAATLQDVVDTPTYEAAQAWDAKLNKACKAVEKERLAFTRQLDDAKKAAMALEKQVCKEARDIQEAIKYALDSYDTKIAQERAAREAAAKAEEEALRAQEAEKGEDFYDTAPLVAVEPELDEPKRSVRKVPRVVITDVAEIPREYLVPNEAAILADLQTGKAIPGTKLVYEEIRVRR